MELTEAANRPCSLFGGVDHSQGGNDGTSQSIIQDATVTSKPEADVSTLHPPDNLVPDNVSNEETLSDVLSILSLPFEILQIIVTDPALSSGDQFAFKLANRSFLYLKPDWQTLKTTINPEGRYELACRLGRVLSDSYLCSACRKRHDAAFFSPTEQRKTDQERKCIGMFSGVLVFENTLLTIKGIQELLSEPRVTGYDPHVPESFFLEQCDKNLQRNGGTGLSLVRNPIKLSARVSNHAHSNYLQYTLKHVEDDGHIWLIGRVHIYFPWLEFFISIAEHANRSNSVLQTAWYHHTRPWNIPFCEHEDLSNSRVCAGLVENIRGRLHDSNGYCIATECSKCLCLISLKIKKGSTRLEVRTERYLGAGLDPCDPRWIRNLHTVKPELWSFGERWDMRSPRASFLDSMVIG